MLNKGIVSEEKAKPVLDEQTLARLLEAAYVLQEHNREVREMELGLDLKRAQAEAQEKVPSPAPAKPARKRESESGPPRDYTFTLAQIVATQHQIQIRNLQLDEAIALVTERLVEIARADGAAIGIVDGRKVRYRAVAGERTPALGSEVATDRALCLPCIKNGQVFRCPDVNPEFLVDTEECRRRGIESLIAVPIFHEGGVAGGLELYYSTQNGFTDQDIHTCQLMAGLITEALAREEEVTWKQSLASERAMMLEALEKLKPNLSALVEPGPAKEVASSAKPAAVTQNLSEAYFCGNCGHKMALGERFCGQCGTPRLNSPSSTITPIPAAIRPENNLPVRGIRAGIGPEPNQPLIAAAQPDDSLAEALEQQFPDLFKDPEPVAHPSLVKPEAQPQAHIETPSELSLHLTRELEADAEHGGITGQEKQTLKVEEKEPETDEEETAIAKAVPGVDWSSAASAREFLEQVAAGKRRSALGQFWDTRRGDIYLAVAVILVACVIRWGIWSNHPVTATTTPTPSGATSQRKAPDADLSMFDRMLISLGLAEAPAVPEDKGNPSTQVWIDLRTALYYCPGADAYGKTPKGKFMTQRDAQLDSYEPAFRQACN